MISKGGTVFIASDTSKADILVKDGKVAAIVISLPIDNSMEVVRANGKYVLPGFIDAHTHLDMPFTGSVTADDFYTGTVAGAHGGMTSIIDSCVQSKGQSLRAA